jgi:hypothetical protein
MIAPPPFGAIDIGELVKFVVVILFLVITAILKSMGKTRAPQQPGGPKIPPVAGPRPTVPPPGQAGPQAARPRSIQEEIEEFKRRTAEKVQPAESASRRAAEPFRPPTKIEQPVKAEIVRERQAGGKKPKRAKKVIAADKSGETAAAPAVAPIGVFEEEVRVYSSGPGAGLAVLLNNIDNLRQAIVLSEILQRPEDRWK